MNDPPCLGDSEEEEGVKSGAASAAHAPRGSGDAGEVGAVWSSGAVKGPLLLLPLPPSSVGRSLKKRHSVIKKSDLAKQFLTNVFVYKISLETSGKFEF